jgi:hypothetical protein
MIPSFSSLSLHPIVIPAEEGVAKREKTSCPRKRASRKLRKSNWFWTPAFAGVTEKKAFATPSEAGIQEPAYQQPVLDPRFRGGDECERCQGNPAFDNRPENLTKPLQKLPEMRGWLRF